MEKNRRIGIMGGTFNPIHIAHLVLAENAYHAFLLDEILMLPNGDPPHKTDIKIVSAKHRINMVEKAISDIDYFHLSKMEVLRKGYSYTSDTLLDLKQKYPTAEIYFIMGADSIFQIETWHEPAIVLSNCIVLAAVRDHVSKEALLQQIHYLNDKYHADIRLLDIPDLEISSSDIRKRIANHQTVRFMVPDNVIHYIEENGLYQEEKV